MLYCVWVYVNYRRIIMNDEYDLDDLETDMRTLELMDKLEEEQNPKN